MRRIIGNIFFPLYISQVHPSIARLIVGDSGVKITRF